LERADEVGKVWVLDTQTKGTGATMVPLERILRKPGSETVPGFDLPKLKPRPPAPPEPPQPRLFKVIDVMTREIVGENLDARGVVSLLADFRSSVDVEMFVWEPKAERWRMLTLGESQTLWQHREERDAERRDNGTSARGQNET
jgi:hypothetical protein